MNSEEDDPEERFKNKKNVPKYHANKPTLSDFKDSYSNKYIEP